MLLEALSTERNQQPSLRVALILSLAREARLTFRVILSTVLAQAGSLPVAGLQKILRVVRADFSDSYLELMPLPFQTFLSLTQSLGQVEADRCILVGHGAVSAGLSCHFT